MRSTAFVVLFIPIKCDDPVDSGYLRAAGLLYIYQVPKANDSNRKSPEHVHLLVSVCCGVQHSRARLVQEALCGNRSCRQAADQVGRPCPSAATREVKDTPFPIMAQVRRSPCLMGSPIACLLSWKVSSVGIRCCRYSKPPQDRNSCENHAIGPWVRTYSCEQFKLVMAQPRH